MENNININTGNQASINLGDKNGKLLGREKEFSIFDSALACVIFILLSAIFSVFYSKLLKAGYSFPSSSVWYYVIQTAVEAVFAVTAIIVAYTRKVDFVKATGMNKKVNWSIVGWCFLASIISLYGFANLTNVFIEFLEYLGYSSILGTIEINSFWQYLGFIISSCLVAGFCEELLFRGVVESGLKKWGIKIAIGFSALIFMLMHGNAEQTIHQFIVGVIVGYVFYKTNNLWLGVLIHAFNNFVPITQAYLLSFVETSEVVTETTASVSVGLGTILIDLIIAIFVAWAGLYFLKMVLNRIIKEDEKLNKTEKTDDNLVSIKVDGNEEQIEMSIDGAPAGNVDTKQSQEKPVITSGTILLFVLSGLYLVGTWIINTLAGFL